MPAVSLQPRATAAPALDVYTVRAVETCVADPPHTAALLAPLNAQQAAVVQHGNGPLLVVAGAGSGKTLALTSRLARLVLDGAAPQRLLLMTFSRRAAAEMERRAARLLHRALGLPATARAPVLPWCGTFHSVAARLLREHARQLGLDADFTVVDRADAEELMALTRTRLELHRSEQRFPLAATCLAILSRVVNSRRALAEVLAAAYPWCAAHEADLQRLFAAYTDAKQAQRVLDYDDLLLYWHGALQEPAVARAMASRFDHVLVDEVQDNNRLQAEILHALSPSGRGLTLVGDDAQAIYSFRAADVTQMLEFPTRHDPPARVLMLEHNYRSTQPILAAAQAVIEGARRRFAKTLRSDRASSQRPALVHVEDEAAQARWVADAVLHEREAGVALKRQAVLFRTAHHSAALELELTRRGIPFVKYGGLRFLEAAHVKDLLALLRWTHNPRCRLAGFRVVRLVAGIGPAAALRLLDAMDGAEDPRDVLRRWTAPPRARADWDALRGVLLQLGDATGLPSWPADVHVATAWLQAQLPRLYGEDARVRAGDLGQLARLAAGHADRAAFLTDLTLDPPQASGDESGEPQRDEDYLILSTIHSAKGQEWQAVHVLNVVDGCLPADLATGSEDEIDEERRLLYVAMTRAREQLSLIVPQRFHVTQQRTWGGRHLYAPRSRFITDAMEPLFEIVTVPGGHEAPGAADGLPAVDLLARARAAWR